MNEVEMAKQRRGEKRRRKGLSVFRLKMIGALFMALGVAGVSVLPSMLGDPTQDMAALTVVVACTAASWCAIPIYSWLLFDGYRHTGSIGKYVLRLFIVAVVSDVPYDLIMTGKPFDLSAQNSSPWSCSCWWIGLHTSTAGRVCARGPVLSEVVRLRCVGC